ncbi:transcription factor IIA subunit alpha [Sorochytrium milnesiophthora]
MSNTIVPEVYREVMLEVIEAVREDFENYGIDDSVLDELRNTWEAKLLQSRVADFGALLQEPDYYDNQFDNDYYPNGDPAGRAAGVLPLATPAYSGAVVRENGQHPNAAPLYIPQNDGPSDEPSLTISRGDDGNMYVEVSLPERPHPAIDGKQRRRRRKPVIPQADGPHGSDDDDDDDDDDDEEDDDDDHANAAGPSTGGSTGSKRTVGAAAAAAAAAAVPGPGGKGRKMPIKGYAGDPSLDDEELNSDLDDTDEEDNDETDADATNLMLCQYEKVSRTKNKWKAQFKDGIVNINGRDYMFNKANGDSQF